MPRHTAARRSGKGQPDQPGDGQQESQQDILLAFVLLIRKGRNDHCTQHTADQHQRAQGTGIRGGESARADDILHPGGDAIEDAHADKGNDQVEPELFHFEGMFQTIQHQRAHFLPFRAGRRGWFFAREDQEQHCRERAAIRRRSTGSAGWTSFSIRIGVSTMPRAVPTRLESVTSPTAVARSSMLNHCAGTLVQALSRKGWAMAMPMVLMQHQ